jgi:hypothetical protein
MRSIPIAQIEVAESGLLNVAPAVPTSEHFEHIYRTATGVRWLSGSRSFSPARMAELSHAQWFAEIVGAAASEYGVQLEITPHTKWQNVPPAIRAEIESRGNGLPSNTSLEWTRER